MGMGHYERLLIRSLIASGVLENGWRFDIRFAGRAPKGGLAPEELAPGLTGASFEGYSPARLASLPWPVARRRRAAAGGTRSAPLARAGLPGTRRYARRLYHPRPAPGPLRR